MVLHSDSTKQQQNLNRAKPHKMPANSEIHDAEPCREDGSGRAEEAPAERSSYSLFCDERGYLEQIRYILEHGQRKGDRTGTGVVSVFGSQARYNLRGMS